MYVKVHVYCNLIFNIHKADASFALTNIRKQTNKPENTIHQNTTRKGNLDKTIIIRAGKAILNTHVTQYSTMHLVQPTSQAIQAGLSNDRHNAMSFNVIQSHQPLCWTGSICSAASLQCLGVAQHVKLL